MFPYIEKSRQFRGQFIIYEFGKFMEFKIKLEK